MSDPVFFDIPCRMRRRRSTPGVRALLEETQLSVNDLIAPLFVHEKEGPPEPVDSMPGVSRFSPTGLVEECKTLHGLGIKAVAIFPCIRREIKDLKGSYALNSTGLIPQVISAVKREIPGLIVITDVALDPYTSHGHDGLVNEKTGEVENDCTVKVLQELAVLEAKAGADWVAPSDMMDGRIGAIRQALDDAGYQQTSILSYAVKFASAYYGPFRDAIGSKQTGGYLDKRSYQLNPTNRREALQEALQDEEEGADLLMVKPAGPYLDIIRDVRERTLLPVVAYQVSGEYAQLHAASRLGWLDLVRSRNESLVAIKRAGADLIITYFAGEMAKALANNHS